MIQKLLSLPPNLAEAFHDLTGARRGEWFVTSDPPGQRLGSGGGTAWLMDRWRESGGDDGDSATRRIIIHAGGQSRRLPGYASSGKILTPVPVFRWERGQRIDQDLLSLQLPLYERILEQAPPGLRTLIASGDVYIRAEKPLQPIPDADVVCYGLWVDPALASRHGVFVSSRETPEKLECMLQKPSLARLEELSDSRYFLMDIGVWLLSDRAMELLCRRGAAGPYDLYAEFGGALGTDPVVDDPEVNLLRVAILPLPGGEFYHYGTSRELLSSTAAVQNKVHDQRRVMQRRLKPNSTLFVQNTRIGYRLSERNDSVWVENAYVPASWTLTSRNIVTGVPENDWSLTLREGICLDIEPIAGTDAMAVRPYGFDDLFRGDPADPATLYLGQPLTGWMKARGLTPRDFPAGCSDLQSLPLFPLMEPGEDMGRVVAWMTGEPDDEKARELWRNAIRLSADEIGARADLRRLFAMRRRLLDENIGVMADNWHRSVYYQLDLDHLAGHIAAAGLPAPAPLGEEAPADKRMHNAMLRSRIAARTGDQLAAASAEAEAFAGLRDMLLGDICSHPMDPRLSVFRDQIVWGRSPVRIDLAGGWTDTPPYSIFNGGTVVNMAVDLNGQQPLQVYVKPSEEPVITLRSIDMSASERVTDWESLGDFSRVGSPFSIPKAALALAGFLPQFSAGVYGSLREQLEAFGAGIELTLLSAIPAGSGLGTSSILASTVLGAVSDFCGLAWDDNEICDRTLALEQLLTTGGGWQDQYGGVLRGVKLLQSSAGAVQIPRAGWLPEHLFESPDLRACHLLYYTGITRTAKQILAEIVRGMFLNSGRHLGLLADMKEHAAAMAEVIQRGEFDRYGHMILKTWELNKALDAGTNPPEVEAVIRRVKDYCLGYKLPGAGGGGYLYMVAKDPEAASRIVTTLTREAPNRLARFVSMTLSRTGLAVSRS